VYILNSSVYREDREFQGERRIMAIRMREGRQNPGNGISRAVSIAKSGIWVISATYLENNHGIRHGELSVTGVETCAQFADEIYGVLNFLAFTV
jgi:hypothetical protein